MAQYVFAPISVHCAVVTTDIVSTKHSGQSQLSIDETVKCKLVNR